MSYSSQFLWDDYWKVIRINGLGTKSFLNGQTSSDIFSFQIDNIFHTCWLTCTGRVRALLEIKLDEKGADLIVLAGDHDELYKGLEQIIFPADKISINCPGTVRRLQILSEVKFNQETKIVWVKSSEKLPRIYQNLTVARQEDIFLWRTQSFSPLGKGEINGEFNPFELGLSKLVSLEKGCYLGQETIAKLFRSGQIKQELKAWQGNGQIASGHRLINESLNEDNNNIAGVITSSLFYPDSCFSRGLAMIRKGSLLEKKLTLEGNESPRKMINLI